MSLASDETPHCYVTDGDSDKLVGSMMSGLSTISDAAFDMLIPSCDNVLNELDARKKAWDEAERKALKEDESEQGGDEELEMGEVKTSPYKTLIGQLLGWLHQLPVIGFNSRKYDLNVIKQLFVPYVLKPSKQDDNDDKDEDIDEEDDDDDETRFVIKRQNTFMCFTTKKLNFLDVTNYLTSGFASCRKVTSHTSTWKVSGNWRIVLYLPNKRSTVDSRTKIYPTISTLAVRPRGVTIV